MKMPLLSTNRTSCRKIAAIVRPALGLTCLGLLTTATQAQVPWINTNGGFYETGSNWSTGSVPLATDQIFFGQAGDYQVGFFGDHTAAGMFVTSDSHPTFSISPAPTADRTLTVNDDITLSLGSSLTLDSTGGPGRMIVVNSADTLYLNGYAHEPDAGMLTLLGGAQMRSGVGILADTPDSAGRVLISGVGSEWEVESLSVGINGLSTIDIEQGGQLTCNSFASARNAIINVRGVGADGQPSAWTNNGDATFVSSTGPSAEINILDGATATLSPTGSVNIADIGTTATIFVRGTDALGNPSTLTTGTLEISQYGGDTDMTIDEGARLISRQTAVGPAGFAHLIVDGTDANGNPSQWTANLLYVSSGRIDITNGARIEVSGTLSIAEDGSLLVYDGTLSADRIELSTTAPQSRLAMYPASLVEFNRFEGDLNYSTGTMAPGIDRATSIVTGDLLPDSDAVLLLEVGGTAGQHDALGVGGLAEFGGSLVIELTDGFVPAATDTFPVLSAASILGSFDNVANGERLQTLDGAGSFVVNYGTTSQFDADRVILSDFELNQSLIGDVNRDGAVTVSDIGPFIDVLAGGMYQAEADINQDGAVTVSDIGPFVSLLASAS